MQRIKNRHAAGRRMPAEDAALLIKDGMNVITSGFTPSGYPKAVPLALARRVESGESRKSIFTGASVGDELDGSLSRVGAVARRFPYQTNADMRKASIKERSVSAIFTCRIFPNKWNPASMETSISPSSRRWRFWKTGASFRRPPSEFRRRRCRWPNRS